MVSLATRGLTGVSFRRDIKFFIAALVGFLVVMILALLTLLQSLTTRTAAEKSQQWELAADISTDALYTLDPSTQRSEIESQLVFLRGRFDIEAIALHLRDGKSIFSGPENSGTDSQKIQRAAPFGTITYFFDATELSGIRRTFLLTTVVCITASVLGTILLLIYLRRVTRPIDQLLGEANTLEQRTAGVDEDRYLIETFKRSITRLREQESELIRLHESEKTRADDLQRVTATLTRSLSSGFIAIDSRRHILDMNGAAREILRVEPSVETSDRDYIEALGENAFTAVLTRAIEHRQTISREEINHSVRGEEVTIGMTIVPLMGDEEKFLGVIALFADLTPIRSLETRVRDMQTLADLGEISAGIAHEFRNSLSTILGYLKLARRDELPEPVEKRLAYAEEEASALSRAVEGLLNFARPMTLDFHKVDIAELTESIVEKLATQTEQIAFSFRTEPTLIDGDRVLLSRALENIIRNAIDATHENGREGRIEIHTTSEPRPLLLVRDNGVGVDPADVPRLFLPFQSGKPSGMGLGLPLARKIIILHGGSIKLTGTPGQGASVTVEFPVPRIA